MKVWGHPFSSRLISDSGWRVITFESFVPFIIFENICLLFYFFRARGIEGYEKWASWKFGPTTTIKSLIAILSHFGMNKQSGNHTTASALNHRLHSLLSDASFLLFSTMTSPNAIEDASVLWSIVLPPHAVNSPSTGFDPRRTSSGASSFADHGDDASKLSLWTTGTYYSDGLSLTINTTKIVHPPAYPEIDELVETVLSLAKVATADCFSGRNKASHQACENCFWWSYLITVVSGNHMEHHTKYEYGQTLWGARNKPNTNRSSHY